MPRVTDGDVRWRRAMRRGLAAMGIVLYAYRITPEARRLIEMAGRAQGKAMRGPSPRQRREEVAREST